MPFTDNIVLREKSPVEVIEKGERKIKKTMRDVMADNMRKVIVSSEDPTAKGKNRARSSRPQIILREGQ